MFKTTTLPVNFYNSVTGTRCVSYSEVLTTWMLTCPRVQVKRQVLRTGPSKLFCNCIVIWLSWSSTIPVNATKTLKILNLLFHSNPALIVGPNVLVGQFPHISITKLQSCFGIYFRSPCISWISNALESNKITVPLTARKEKKHSFRKKTFQNIKFCWYLCLHDIYIYKYIHTYYICIYICGHLPQGAIQPLGGGFIMLYSTTK